MRRYRQHRYSLICVESTAHLFQITAVSNRSCPLLFRNSDPARPPFYSRHFFKSPRVRNMESASKRSTYELACKRKTNGFIVWEWFGFKVSNELQNLVFCRECYKSVATKGSSTTNVFYHLQHHHKMQYEECSKCMQRCKI